MGRVFVAGSINMDVVATASRHPRVGETVAGQAVHYFPGGKGANQAVAAAKLGAPATLIGRLGTDAFGQQLRTFLAAQGVDLALVKDTAGYPYRNGHHHHRRCRQHHRGRARRQRAGQCRGCRRPRACQGRRRRQPVRNSASPRSARSSNGRARPGRPPSSIRRRRSPAARSCSILSISSILNETELGVSRTDRTS